VADNQKQILSFEDQTQQNLNKMEALYTEISMLKSEVAALDSERLSFWK
jgi:hypothetical protein